MYRLYQIFFLELNHLYKLKNNNRCISKLGEGVQSLLASRTKLQLGRKRSFNQYGLLTDSNYHVLYSTKRFADHMSK